VGRTCDGAPPRKLQITDKMAVAVRMASVMYQRPPGDGTENEGGEML